MKLFYFELHEQNGEYEYTYDHLIKAENLEEAQKLVKEYIKGFYGILDEIEIETSNHWPFENVYWFNGRTIAMEIDEVCELTKKEFMKRAYQKALVYTKPLT